MQKWSWKGNKALYFRLILLCCYSISFYSQAKNHHIATKRFRPAYAANMINSVTPITKPQASNNDLAQRPIEASGYREVLLDIQLNGHSINQTGLVLVNQDNKIWINQQDLKSWRLTNQPENAQMIKHLGDTYIALEAISSITFQINEAQQSLQISAEPDQFTSTSIDVYQKPQATPQMTVAGGFLNYDFSVQHLHRRKTVSGLFEFGAFAHGGVLTNQLLSRDLTDPNSLVRLESTLTFDKPEQMASLRLGDTISRGGSWGRPVRLAGIQWGTNFATQPSFITFPMPSISGSTALPSTADVFVNNLQTYHQEVQSGPFSIRELPVITGQGEIRMVVRDLLGREQVISQSFYAAPNLLRRGLKDFSYELGFERNNFSINSYDYGRLLSAATLRQGITDQFTAETRGELGSKRQVLGLTGTFLLNQIGVSEIGVAASHSSKGLGGLAVLGIERLTQSLSFGARTIISSHQFSQSGFVIEDGPPLQQTTAHIGWRNSKLGSFGLGYIRQNNRNRPDAELINANYNKNLGYGWFLNLSVGKNLNGSQDHSLGISLTYALGRRTSVNSNANWRSNGTNSAFVQLQQNLPLGDGFGYRVLAGVQGNERLEAALSMQNQYGTYRLEAGRTRSTNAYRATARGGLAFMGQQFFAARHLGDSFAVVRLPGYPGVQVYSENQPVARTDKSGMALIPRLRPFQQNRISIEQMDLPLNTQIKKLEKIAVPYFRSGYAIDFPLQEANDATLNIIDTNGKSLPAGTLVSIAGKNETFIVAFNGQVYLSNLDQENQIVATFPDASTCAFEMIYPETKEPMPDLGTFQCH
jgi:outer membrane usher protein